MGGDKMEKIAKPETPTTIIPPMPLF